MPLTPNPLLADLGDVLKNLAPIIFVVLYGVAHLVGNLQQEKRKAPPPRPRPIPPPGEPAGEAARHAAPANPAGNAPTLEETLRREVEEFLRRAQGGQPQPTKAKGPGPRQSRPQQRPTARGPVKPTERAAEERTPPRRLVETTRPEPTPTSSLSESRPSLSPASLGAGVAAHAQSLAAQVKGVSLHAQSLGSDIAQADERMQEHLRQKFVHQVGAIAPLTSVQRQATGSPAAAELREMLARPGGAKQLIIASEILRRPEERWEN